jgi:hypothetical protein
MSFCLGTPKLEASKFLKLGLFQLCRPIIFCADLRLKWGFKKSCSPGWELYSDMWHATCQQVNQGDSWLLVVGSQIANLTLDLSFGNNLCFKYSNGSCEPILDIYIPSGYLKIHHDSNSQSGSPLGRVWVHSLTLSYTPGSMKCDSQASLLARTFVSPCLGHEPKVKVATQNHEWNPKVLNKFVFLVFILTISKYNSHVWPS